MASYQRARIVPEALKRGVAGYDTTHMRAPERRRAVADLAPSLRRVRGRSLFAPSPRPQPARTAFSLIELVIVVTILAIIASIALRRVSSYAEQGAENAAAQDVSVLQLAIERYRAEHGNYPDPVKVVKHLTGYTDVFGATSAERVAPYIYGPYVRAIPPVPLGPAKGSKKIATAPADDVGWLYDPISGEIAPNE